MGSNAPIAVTIMSYTVEIGVVVYDTNSMKLRSITNMDYTLQQLKKEEIAVKKIAATKPAGGK